MSKCVTFRAQQDAEIRTEMLFGREHLVVPIVALVEGVLQGENAAVPELALADEFGKLPQSWDGRPVVMNHPVVDNVPVSANSPIILETYAFGSIYNTRLEDSKLKTEAWIDIARVESLGGETESTVQRIKDGKPVEVSTGLFTGVEQTQGIYNNRAYQGIWRGVVPDHLAILSDGVLGACSIADGCGARINSAKSNWQEYQMSEAVLKTNCSGNTDCGCPPKVSKISSAQGESNAPRFNAERFLANSIPNTLLDSDVRKLLSAAVKNAHPHYCYLLGFTTEKVLYETWATNYDNYVTYQRSYSIDNQGVVTLADDISHVNIISQVVPANNMAKTLETVVANSTDKENEMADDNVKKDDLDLEQKDQAKRDVAAADENAETRKKAAKDNEATPSGNETPTKEKATKQMSAGDQPVTFEALWAAAPSEMREVLESGIKLHKEKKANTIRALQATGRCKFSDDQLKGMSMDMLDSLVELASVPSFDGANPTPRQNSRTEDEVIPPAPKLTF